MSPHVEFKDQCAMLAALTTSYPEDHLIEHFYPALVRKMAPKSGSLVRWGVELAITHALIDYVQRQDLPDFIANILIAYVPQWADAITAE